MAYKGNALICFISFSHKDLKQTAKYTIDSLYIVSIQWIMFPDFHDAVLELVSFPVQAYSVYKVDRNNIIKTTNMHILCAMCTLNETIKST